MLWALLPALLGAAPALILIGAVIMMPQESISIALIAAVGVFILVWTGGFCVIGVWKAGLGVLFVVLLPVAAVYILLLLYLAHTAMRRGTEKGSSGGFLARIIGGDLLDGCTHNNKEEGEDAAVGDFEMPLELSTNGRDYPPAEKIDGYVSSSANDAGVDSIPSAPIETAAISQAIAVEEITAVSVDASLADAHISGAAIEAELKRLKALYERGLVAEDFYERRVSSLLLQLSPDMD